MKQRRFIIAHINLHFRFLYPHLFLEHFEVFFSLLRSYVHHQNPELHSQFQSLIFINKSFTLSIHYVF